MQHWPPGPGGPPDPAALAMSAMHGFPQEPHRGLPFPARPPSRRARRASPGPVPPRWA